MKISDKIVAELNSPSIAALLLVNGILLGFIATHYLGVTWVSTYTKIFYAMVLIWGAWLITHSNSKLMLKLTKVDVLFGVFVIAILLSSAINYWSGTFKYLTYIPIFLVLPYLLGRLISGWEVLKFQTLLVLFGCLLILLTPYEYYVMKLPHPDWPVPVIFGLPHGVMLSGLILCPMMIVIAIKILFSIEESRSKYYYGWYVLMFVAIVTVGWMQARGSILAIIACIPLLLIMSPSINIIKKIALIIIILIGAFCVTINPYQNPYSKRIYMQIFDSIPSIVKVEPAFSNKDQKLNTSVGNVIELNEGAAALDCHSVKNSVNDRWMHYQTSFALFMRHPYWGAGANKYGHYSCAGPGWYPHSTMLQVLAELGIFVFLVYSYIIFLSIRGVVTRFKEREDVIDKSILSFVLLYFIFQLITSQIYGNYFMSSGLYFAIGMASRIEGSDFRVSIWRGI